MGIVRSEVIAFHSLLIAGVRAVPCGLSCLETDNVILIKLGLKHVVDNLSVRTLYSSASSAVVNPRASHRKGISTSDMAKNPSWRWERAVDCWSQWASARR